MLTPLTLLLALSASGLPAADHLPGQVLVKFRSLPDGLPAVLSAGKLSALPKPHQALLSRHGALGARRVFADTLGSKALSYAPLLGRSVPVPELYRWQIIDVSTDADVDALARALAQDPLVEAAEPNRLVPLLVVPDDPSFATQWHHRNTGQNGGVVGDDIQSVMAWDKATGSPGAIVAVLDTGVDLTHPDLVANLATGYDYYDDDAVPADSIGHGTHVAGIIAAAGNNGIGVAGVMWRAQILPIRVCDAACPSSAIANGLHFAADNAARVVNMSFGGTGVSALQQDAINYADALGVLLVAAAGNSNSSTQNYPAAFDNVIAVAATNSSDQKASFSSYGSWVDISAPGEEIYSTYLAGAYSTLSGTSMASPVIAGAAGLIFVNRPTWTAAQVRAQLLATTHNIDAQNAGYVGLLGSGRLNLNAALPLAFQVTSLTLNPDELSVRNWAHLTFQAAISTAITASQVLVSLADQLGRELGSGNTVAYSLTDSTHISGDLQIGSLSLTYPLTSEVRLRFVFSVTGSTATQDAKTWSFVEFSVLPPGGRAAVWNAVFDPNEAGRATVRATLERAGRVLVLVYRGDGTLVRHLVDEDVGLGVKNWDWDGKNDDGRVVASGVYLVRIQGPGFTMVKRVIVVK